MITAALFQNQTQANAIRRGGPGWLRSYAAMVFSWAADIGIDRSTVESAIELDVFAVDVPKPHYFSGRCVAVTSINPNPARSERQLLCLRSWHDFGLPCVSVNTSGEIAQISQHYPFVDFVACDDMATHYDRPTQRVNSLINAGIERAVSFMVINSDIEIYGRRSDLDAALQHSDTLTIGVRYNHGERVENPQSAPVHLTATKELYGLDAFLMTPALAATLPSMPFGLGKPMWDYWLPHHFRSLGYRFHWIQRPFFFHENHSRQWSNAEWLFGAEAMDRKYGIRLAQDSFSFRKSL